MNVPEEAGQPLFAVGEVVLNWSGRRVTVEDVSLYSSLEERTAFGLCWWTYDVRISATAQWSGVCQRHLRPVPAIDRLADLV